MSKNLLLKGLKEDILKIAHKTKEGHVPSAFSILDILYVLYNKVLKIDPVNTHKEDRDYFIMSKGHAAIGLYAVLADRGFFDKREMEQFGKYKSRLGGHPDMNKVPGVEASTGSLGHGLPIAVGIAMGLSYKEKGQKVYCLIGDGELNEGSMWEAIIIAGQQNLSNLVCILDNNHSIDRSVIWGNLENKFSDFGWDVVSINGHDHSEIEKALNTITVNKPILIIANTIKGNGCQSIENNPAWHHRAPNKEELEKLLEELV
ncbi:transketolase [Phascolarctobacterium faecium]|mgnify:FL=1|uniref:transketolase n=1 Tax=Phascolarctobacterium faecium TaxID=33025 RepID=UPI00210B15E9|nr:transketolase [Phascolarctobacterium faecium]MCQ4906768.1 transketolase [Phascolarctobacterium faecium]